MDDRIGQQLGNYRILRLLGQGGFADVYLGEHIHLRTQAAIKVLQVRLVENNIQSFLNEARTIAHLVHPYIIRVLDFGVETNAPFLVMDYAPKGTFRQHFLQGKPLPPAPLFPYIKQAASALQYAHDKKLIHRDVKPENMLLGPNEEILLSDFGFALMQTSVARPSTETAGTASYMAPEQFQGKPQAASDQYSLAVIAYEWLTGSCPFQGSFMELASQHMVTQPPSLVQRVPGLSAQVAQVVMTALAKEPDQRFPTVRDFARALEHACLASPKNLASSPALVSSPLHTTAPGLSTSQPGINRTGTTWAGVNQTEISWAGVNSAPTSANPGSSPSQSNQRPQPGLNSPYQPLDEFETHFQFTQQSPAFQSGQRSFSPELTPGISSPERPSSFSSGASPRNSALQPLSSSFEAFSREKTPPLSSSTPFSQSMSNAVQNSQSNLRPSSSWQAARPTTSSNGQTVPYMHTTERFSQSNLPPLPPLPSQGMTQDRSRFTNDTQLSPLQPWEQSFSSGLYRSQSQLPVFPELPPLPQQPFLAPELARQNMPTSPVSQTSPVQQNTTMGKSSQSFNTASVARPGLTGFNEQLSPFSASGQRSTSQPTPLVRTEDFWTTPKHSTSRTLYFFVIFMMALIIGSTAILIVLTNSQHNGLNKASSNLQQPATHANVTATPAPQKSTQTPVAPNQTEQNPYGNHNGILVLNDPLNQQDPQMQWNESATTCLFSAGSYHVTASNQSQGFTICNATASSYTNFVYQVQMTFTKVTSTVGSGGLVFRENKANNQFYFWEIFTNGTYAFYRCPGANGGSCLALASLKTGIPSFHTDLNRPNTIAIVANANTFTIYVNNQLLVGPVTDPAFSQGKIGMMARQSDTNAVTDVSFNNIKIWQL